LGLVLLDYENMALVTAIAYDAISITFGQFVGATNRAFDAQ
jgi:hypothetical protein